ncbi:dihydrofolate reductase family protein [Allorhizocola rhizosphaerae]|uniref:dihydrofolate reductase family protein n=1 Tax=Allorhizocola rhizosphaerae TaxID=1872709 RepID=UPI000E3CA337|nr:dihydrofolate reductase family protein [Allorhizocola rhizosphaerae]
MTKTQYYTATSVDGFIADPDNSLTWLFQVDTGGVDDFPAFFEHVGAMCMGATTYEWCRENMKPGEWRGYYADTPCWVFTHRSLPTIPDANLIFVSGDVAPVHDEMVRAANGKNVYLVGGGELVGRFADQNRLDEIILGVAAVTLGGGAPVLPRRLLSDRLNLTDVTRHGQFAKLTYELHPPRA